MEYPENQIQNKIFCTSFDEGIQIIPCFALIQFLYTAIVWAVVLSEKTGYIFIQLAAFLGHLLGNYIIIQTIRYNYEDLDNSGRRFWTKMFPIGAFFGIFWSFTPLIICFISGIRSWFIDEAGKIVICCFSSLFLLNWINIYVAGEFNRKLRYPLDGEPTLHINVPISNRVDIESNRMQNEETELMNIELSQMNKVEVPKTVGKKIDVKKSEGRLYKGTTTDEIYWILDRKVRLIPNDETYNNLFNGRHMIKTVPDAIMEECPKGQPVTDGACIIQAHVGGWYYLHIDNKRRHIEKPSTFSDYNLYRDNVKKMPLAEIKVIPAGINVAKI